jgi:hypothetical protein
MLVGQYVIPKIHPMFCRGIRMHGSMYERTMRLKDVIREEHSGTTGVKVRDQMGMAGRRVR